MRRIIFDIEADGLIETATKIHCLSYYDIDTKESGTLTNYTNMKILLSQCSILTGHKIITFDIPMLEKFLGIDLSSVRQIDTLGLSWYLYPNRIKHGLEGYGVEFGIDKPEIEVWVDDGTPEFTSKMIYRCSEDVKINTKLWDYQLEYLLKIYKDRGEVSRIIDYISFKLKCAREQEEMKIKIDVEKCKENLEFLQNEAKNKVDILKTIMPRVNKYVVKSKPKVMYKKDGDMSELGMKWEVFLCQQGLPLHHNGAVKYIKSTKEANPNSHDQVKAWLYTLGWKPETFKWVRKKVGGVTDYSKPARKVEQIGSDDNTGLCQSVKKLFEKEPRLEELEDLYMINNRISYLTGNKGNSFLECVDENGFIKAEISGFTNTLRFTHKKPIANLPVNPKLYSKKVRELLIAPDEDHVLCGADLSGLEDQTKRHYMYYYDPQYVEEMKSPDFDPHLYIAVKAGILTQEAADVYNIIDKMKKNKEYIDNEDEALFEKIKGERLKAKKTNFAAIYGAGIPKLAVTANISIKESTIFHTTYWKVNWSIKEIVRNTITKKVDGQGWLWNPVAQLWYSLKTEKDIFSTLNQGTGSYAFDTWVRYCRMQLYKICMQYHDE